MLNPITAIYENGVLRPLTPLGLPEDTPVQIYVQPVSALSEVLEHRRRVHEALIQAGLSLPLSNPAVISSISAERRAELADLFSKGRPLSELIIEEREER